MSAVYEKMWTAAYHPESCPVASSIKMKFPGKNGKPDVALTSMDGNIRPERPAELGDNGGMGKSEGGAITEGTKGKMKDGGEGEEST